LEEPSAAELARREKLKREGLRFAGGGLELLVPLDPLRLTNIPLVGAKTGDDEAESNPSVPSFFGISLAFGSSWGIAYANVLGGGIDVAPKRVTRRAASERVDERPSGWSAPEVRSLRTPALTSR